MKYSLCGWSVVAGFTGNAILQRVIEDIPLFRFDTWSPVGIFVCSCVLVALNLREE